MPPRLDAKAAALLTADAKVKRKAIELTTANLARAAKSDQARLKKVFTDQKNKITKAALSGNAYLRVFGPVYFPSELVDLGFSLAQIDLKQMLLDKTQLMNDLETAEALEEMSEADEEDLWSEMDMVEDIDDVKDDGFSGTLKASDYIVIPAIDSEDFVVQPTDIGNYVRIGWTWKSKDQAVWNEQQPFSAQSLNWISSYEGQGYFTAVESEFTNQIEDGESSATLTMFMTKEGWWGNKLNGRHFFGIPGPKNISALLALLGYKTRIDTASEDVLLLVSW